LNESQKVIGFLQARIIFQQARISELELKKD
jgi:hypothetical protein